MSVPYAIISIMVKGKITKQIGAFPDLSEQIVADIFACEGNNIEFIKPDTRYMVHTPDIKMNGLLWEIKCPESDKMDKIRRNINDALKQSNNVIIGTFETKILDEKIIRYVTTYSKTLKNINKLKIVTKTKEIIDIK